MIEAATSISEEGAAELGNLETVKSDIHRQKRKNLPQEPRSLVEIAVHGLFRLNAVLNPQEFLFYDSGVAAGDNRMLIFGSE